MKRLIRLSATVRFRLTALATLVITVVLVGAAIALAFVQTDLLVEQLDDRLTQRADDLASLVRAGELPRTIGGINDGSVSQVVAPDGQVLAASPALVGRPAIIDPSSPLRTRPRNVTLPIDDDSYRVASRYIFSTDGARVADAPTSIHVARELSDVRESASLLARTLLVIIPIVVALFAALAWWLTGRALRPVEAIRSDVAAISPSDLHRRVPEPRTDDEIARLARTMNAMLDRVEDGARRQERFVADASHELRSPLARMRSELEVDLAHPDRADPMETHRSALEQTIALQHLVDDLLLLARVGASGTGDVRNSVVDLDDIVLRLARRAREDRSLEVHVQDLTALQVRGDARQLERAISNVVDNATRYAKTRVALTLREQDGTAALAVVDDGPGIAAADRERVFDRFTRLDPARSTQTGGAGLGLAIAREIVVRHGGRIEIDGSYSPGTRVVITLPTA